MIKLNFVAIALNTWALRSLGYGNFWSNKTVISKNTYFEWVQAISPVSEQLQHRVRPSSSLCK